MSGSSVFSLLSEELLIFSLDIVGEIAEYAFELRLQKTVTFDESNSFTPTKVAGGNGKLFHLFYNIQTGGEFQLFEVCPRTLKQLRQLQFSKSLQKNLGIASMYYDATTTELFLCDQTQQSVHVYNTTTEKCMLTLGHFLFPKRHSKIHHYHPLDPVAVTILSDRTLLVLDKTSYQVLELQRNGGALISEFVSTAALDQPSAMIASKTQLFIGGDGALQIFDLKTRTEDQLVPLIGDKLSVRGLGLVNDQRHLIIQYETRDSASPYFDVFDIKQKKMIHRVQEQAIRHSAGLFRSLVTDNQWIYELRGPKLLIWTI